jgi:aminoglycoside 3-N-acetyltransferase
VTAEALRRHPNASRSIHPILSFAGVQVESLLARQTQEEPLGPIAALQEREGWVLLLGTDHTCNTSLHYAEKLAGRKQFIRWALTPSGVRECPGWPGCSDGFEQAAPHLERITRRVEIGPATVRALPLAEMTAIVTNLIQEDPLALLCSREDCERCQAVRNDINILIEG